MHDYVYLRPWEYKPLYSVVRIGQQVTVFLYNFGEMTVHLPLEFTVGEICPVALLSDQQLVTSLDSDIHSLNTFSLY